LSVGTGEVLGLIVVDVRSVVHNLNQLSGVVLRMEIFINKYLQVGRYEMMPLGTRIELSGNMTQLEIEFHNGAGRRFVFAIIGNGRYTRTTSPWNSLNNLQFNLTDLLIEVENCGTIFRVRGSGLNVRASTGSNDPLVSVGVNVNSVARDGGWISGYATYTRLFGWDICM